MRILRYISDLHLDLLSEFKQNYLHYSKLRQIFDFKKNANDKYYLGLMGDIGNPYDDNLRIFLDLVSKVYDIIFYVPGNHEYYNCNLTLHRDKDSFDYNLRKLCSNYDNVILLNNDTYLLDDCIMIIGSTLWSHIPKEVMGNIEERINDYIHIKQLNNGILQHITAYDTDKWHKDAKQFILNTIEKSDYPCIILTHHAPLFSDSTSNRYTSDPKYIQNSTTYAFHSDLSTLMNYPVKVWLFGHTHYSTKFTFNDVTIASNQLGYGHEDSTGFNPYAYIDLNTILMDSL